MGLRLILPAYRQPDHHPLADSDDLPGSGAKRAAPPKFLAAANISEIKSNEVEIKEHDPFVWLAPQLANDGPSYKAYAERLMSDLRCYFAGHRCEDADDLAAEVMLRLVRRLETGEPPEIDSAVSKRQYVFGIARNVLLEWRRGPFVREIPLRDDAEPALCLPVDLAAKECLELLAQVVRANLSQLSAAEQDILVQSELNPEYSPTLVELAEQKATKAAAMRQRVHRARVHFRKLLLTSDRLSDLLRCLGLERGRA